MKDGYAIYMGAHRFVSDRKPSATVARFVHLWKWDGGWRVARVLSFDRRGQAAGAPGSIPRP